MYEATIIDIYKAVVVFGFLFLSLFAYMFFYCKYELRALKVEGYIELRKFEKERSSNERIRHHELKTELKIAKINGGK